MPPPSSSIARTSSEPSAAPARSTGLPFTLVARFNRQMKPQRLYPLMVHLRTNKKHQNDGAIGSLHLRPVIPGAIVTPADYTLDLDHPDTKPPFYVTPLAKGVLKNARMEIFHQGRLIGTIPLPMKAVRQTMTWVLLFLTVAIPYSTYWLARHSNFTRSGAGIETRIDKDEEEPGVAEESGAKNPQVDEAQGEKSIPVVPKALKTEGAIEHGVRHFLPDSTFSQTVAGTAQDAYEIVHNGSDYNMSFYLGAILLGLTFISWAMHTTRSCRRKARPVGRGVTP